MSLKISLLFATFLGLSACTPGEDFDYHSPLPFRFGMPMEPQIFEGDFVAYEWATDGMGVFALEEDAYGDCDLVYLDLTTQKLSRPAPEAEKLDCSDGLDQSESTPVNVENRVYKDTVNWGFWVTTFLDEENRLFLEEAVPEGNFFKHPDPEPVGYVILNIGGFVWETGVHNSEPEGRLVLPGSRKLRAEGGVVLLFDGDLYLFEGR